MSSDKFLWKESDLTIEHPLGSGIFIPMREFNRLMDEEQARKKAKQSAGGAPSAEEDPGEPADR